MIKIEQTLYRTVTDETEKLIIIIIIRFTETIVYKDITQDVIICFNYALQRMLNQSFLDNINVYEEISSIMFDWNLILETTSL